jgi:hypothetical protein
MTSFTRSLSSVSLTTSFFFAVLMGGSASAQDMFGNLSWSDSPSQVHKKLVDMGYTGFTTSERASCFVNNSCRGSFNGPSVRKGSVIFSNGVPSTLFVETGDANGAAASLSKRYGAAQAPATPKNPSWLLRPQPGDPKPTHVWTRGRGISITLYDSGLVIYDRRPTEAKDGSGLKNL